MSDGRNQINLCLNSKCKYQFLFINLFYIYSTMKTRKLKGGVNFSVFKSDDISIDPYILPDYRQVGVISVSAMEPISAVRQIGTAWANTFGQVGFETSVYDRLRLNAMHKLKERMETNNIHKVSSLRFDFLQNHSNVVVSCYGNALVKIM